MKTKLCIFDLDGTLINSLYDLADAMNYSLAKHGLPTHAREKYRKMVGSGISVLADRAMTVPEGTDENLKKSVLAVYNERYKEHCMDLTRPYKGIPKLLKKLEELNIKFAVLSNKPDNFTNIMVNTLFPDNHFSAIWGKKEDFPRKPDPKAVFAILESLGEVPQDCLYIGDSDIDIYTAQNAGITACGVSWGFRSTEELKTAGAEHIADTPEDILKYL